MKRMIYLHWKVIKVKLNSKIRKQRRVDNNLLDEEVREEATVEIPIWFGYYEKSKVSIIVNIGQCPEIHFWTLNL